MSVRGASLTCHGLLEPNSGVMSSQGRALSVSPYTGELLGEITLSDPASLAPVVANATLYILTDGAELAAFR